MKKIFPIFISIPLLFSCSKNQPLPENSNGDSINLSYQEKAKPVVFEITSTGCPGCGSWGKPVFSQLIAQYGKQIVPVAVHIKYGDPFITNISETIASNRYGAFYTPQIWINDTNGVSISLGGGIQTEASVRKMNDLINRRLADSGPYLSGLVYEQSSDFIKFKVGVDFKDYEAGGHQYFLSTYLMESQLENHQTGSMSNPTLHHHVIRKSFGDTWGEPVELNNGRFEYKGEFSLEYQNEHHELVIILWRKQVNRYEAVGAFSFK